MKKVLLVDDEQSFLSIMSERIKSWGYEVTCAESGKEAIGFLSEDKADMIILDYKMPEMDGIETLSKIREINKTIPVIMFTAYPDQKSIKGTEGLKISAFIPKSGMFGSGEAALKVALSVMEKEFKKEEDWYPPKFIIYKKTYLQPILNTNKRLGII